MATDENVAAADNGSPVEGKNEALSDFFYDCNDQWVEQKKPRRVRVALTKG